MPRQRQAQARATTREEMQNDLGNVKAAEVVGRLKNYGLAVEDLGLGFQGFGLQG